jgi:hydroxypyruvate reductase
MTVADLDELRRDARAIFDDALSDVDARRAVSDVLEVADDELRVRDARFPLRAGDKVSGLSRPPRKIYSVAVGKAAAAMACALDERLGERLVGGVLSAPPTELRLAPCWNIFEGGHPLPNESSLDAARAAFKLLRDADDSDGLVVFLVSGGGSAMIEWPRDERLTFDDLREMNRVLVTCGASITEVNVVRRALSAVKGGGLSARAPRAAQVTLIVSDVGAGQAYDVASGPTFALHADALAARQIVARYDLTSTLPRAVLRALEESDERRMLDLSSDDFQRHFVLLDNERARAAAAESARGRGFVVEMAHDIVEQPVDVGAAALVARLAELQRRANGRGVCLISGGEFACPVRGAGIGGRNAETALRIAFEFEKIVESRIDEGSRDRSDGETMRGMVALCAGTDGIDGNSPAAGALADTTTLSRARGNGLDAAKFLDGSDAYSFFDRLSDAIVTGPTGTNVRDVRILLAR